MSGPRTPRVVELTGEARAYLEALTRRGTLAASLVLRARIVLLAAEQRPLGRIARELGVDRNVVRTWVDRYRAEGPDGLRDRPRSGRPRSFPPRRDAASGPAGL